MEEVKAKKKNTNIYEAIQKLPDELITAQIWEAAIEEANIDLLKVLPETYLNDDNINTILENSNKGDYNWYNFSLSSIPEQCRTDKVCTIAVDKNLKNYLVISPERRNNQMLLKIMSSAENNLKYLPSVPAESWDEKAALKGVTSIYSSSCNSSYNRKYSYSPSSDKTEQMKLIQILLHYVPEEIKTQSLYMQLFNSSMKVEHIRDIVPQKFKSNAYYLAIARKDIKMVPVEKLNYDTIIAGLLSDKNSICSFFNHWKDKSNIQEPMIKCMDGIMADVIIRREPDKFAELPDILQTRNRLILALDTRPKHKNVRDIYSKFEVSEFDDEICRAIIRKDSECPEFAPAIWTQDFVDYCMEHAQSYNWFRKMPEQFQNQDMIDKVFEHSFRDMECTKKEFISYELAVKAFREKTSSYREEYEYRRFVPSHFINDFQLETGLPKEFFGGKVSYKEVREIRNNYTYCQIGDCYVGFFIDKDDRLEYNRLIMTRRTPMSIKPSVVFSRSVDTFHKTWFEKLISDFDPQFTKPTPANGTKLYQVNPYFEVKQTETISGHKVFVNLLLGEPLYYSVKIDGDIEHRNSMEPLKKLIQEQKQEKLEIAEAC